ncbi:MAG: hypothetical protein E7235_00975 [Lachnospiraceae bacterium]|nr:hypothetical protein [Lachnospiraceae bacterium]
MAEIKMSYIFIEKLEHESKGIREILLEIIDTVAQNRDEELISVGNVDIKYRIIQKQRSKRCFLEMVSTARVNKAVSALQKVDGALLKSEMQKYYYSIKDYDGISESFCKRLYPMYAEFERSIRSMILFILTKAYGSNWKNETVSEDMMNVIRENAKGNVPLNQVLENMDMKMLESYLFDKRDIDYSAKINSDLSAENLEKLEKSEICEIIENMRPTSLWERNFEKIGKQDKWEKRILEIHDMRNKVAHQKTISNEEFTDSRKKIKSINKDLEKAIDGIREDNFTEYSVVDILGNFAVLVGNMKNIIQNQAAKDVVFGFNAKIQEVLGFSIEEYNKNMNNALNNLNELLSINFKRTKFEIAKSINEIYGDFAISRAIIKMGSDVEKLTHNMKLNYIDDDFDDKS